MAAPRVVVLFSIDRLLDAEDRARWESERTMPQETQLQKILRSESDCNSRAFWRAAGQRLQAATLLFESRIYLEAAYLGGYVVQCALKALILERTRAAERRDLCRELASGARYHNFDTLCRILRRKGYPPPPDIANPLHELSEEWRTDLRYVGKAIPNREVERFLERVKAVYEWVERSL